MNLRNLTPASGCQDHTTSPYASAPFVRANCAPTLPRPPHPMPTSVTTAKRPSCGHGIIRSIPVSTKRQSGIFLRMGMDRLLVICPSGSFSITRTSTHAVILGARRVSPSNCRAHGEMDSGFAPKGAPRNDGERVSASRRPPATPQSRLLFRMRRELASASRIGKQPRSEACLTGWSPPRRNMEA
jgi:hypothetical protein